MKYKVLYRKYRPDNFDSIVGQDFIVKTLRNSIKNDNISHAYIFSGPRGTGKTSTAKVFAKAINCLNPVEGSPCGKCEFCTNFQENPDIIEIDAASNNGVDDVRTIIDNVKLTPSNGKYKVYIIDEVHMLTPSAFNALLLTLEEPPSHTIFIMATTNVENVPITILSRCQRFDFQKIKVSDLVNRLKEICELEKIAIDDDALTEIAYLSEGGLRDALSLLDQLSKNNQKISLNLIEEQIKTVSQRGINEIIDTIEENNVEKCLELIDEYRKRAVDYKNFIKKLIDVASKKAKNIKKTGRYKRLNYEDYKELIFNLADSITKVNINVDSFTIFEMVLLEFFDVPTVADGALSQPKEVISVIPQKNVDNALTEEKNTQNTNSIPVTVENNVSEDLINIRINNCFVNAQKNYLEEAKKKIATFANSLNIDGKIKSIMLDSNVVVSSDTNLILTCANSHNVETANKMLSEIETAFKKELNYDYKMIFLTVENWNAERTKYIENLKNKKVYTYIEEPTAKDELSTEINSVFDLSKVEII